MNDHLWLVFCIFVCFWFLSDKLKAWFAAWEARSLEKHEKRMDDPEYRELYLEKQREYIKNSDIALRLSEPQKYWALEKKGKLRQYLLDRLSKHLSR
jgi:hypothetical protein